MKLHVIMNEVDKLSEIQLLKNHDLIIINLIFMNNFYFLDIVNFVKDSAIMKDLSILVNITDKKSNYR